MGAYWQHTYERRLLLLNYGGGVFATYETPDGRMRHFSASGAEILNRDGAAARLNSQSDGTWIVVLPNSDQEHFDATGRLTSITRRSGAITTIAYGSNGLASTVTDQFGRQLQLGYDGQNRLSSLTNPGGGIIGYSYDANGTLSIVTYPDAQTRTYVYGSNSAGQQMQGLLTGIIDESNNSVAAFGYSTSRLTTSAQHAGGVDSYTFSYSGSSASTTVTDPLGTNRVYAMNSIGGVFHASSVSGGRCANCDSTASSTFDANGNVASRVDFNGNTTCYQYDLVRNLETTRVEGFAPGISCPSSLSTYSPTIGTRQRKIATTWAANYRSPSLIVELNRSTAYTYDAAGNVLTKTVTDTSVTPNVSRTWTYTYNSFGQVLTADGPRTDVVDKTTYTYFSCTTGFQCGQLNTVTNAANQVTTFNSYNAHGLPLTITDPNGVLTTLAYDARQRLISSQVGSETTTYSYWPTGLIKKITLPNLSFIQYSYDAAHRLTDITDGANNHIHYTLDTLGNRTAKNVYDPSNVLSRAQSQVFNSLGQLTQQIGSAGTAAVTTTFGYNSNGKWATANAPLGRNTANTFDELSRLNQITDPAGGITQFGYDANNNLTSVKDPGNLITTYAYSGFRGLNLLVSPATGTSNYTYDSGGNLKTRVDARGLGGTYSYDAVNRVTQVAYGDQTINYGYDSGAYGKGRMTSASDTAHSMSWVYDALGRVTSKSQTVAGAVRTLGYTYTNGQLTNITTPSGQNIGYTYTNGQVTGIAVNGTTVLSNVAYEPFGPPRSWTWSNGTTESRLHDTDGNPSLLTGAESTSYSLDNAFRIQGITNSSTSSSSWGYGYDSLDRLTVATNSGNTINWTIDANGNRQTQASAANPVYAASNLTFSYNNRGRMASVTASGTTNYVYNALGQRIEKSGPGGVAIFAYDEAGRLLGEYTGAGALVQETVWLGDLPIATIRPNGAAVTVYFVHADHLGAPRTVTRSSDNAIVWRWDTDPFGVATPNQNPGGLGTFLYNLRFPGQYYDAETGLSQNYHRDYDSSIGRYAESDPVGLLGGLNSYAYGLVSPLMYFDPFGLSSCTDFVKSLLNLWTLSKSSEDLGQKMLALRETNPPHYDGFKSELVSGGQGTDVYHHVYGHGGAVLGYNLAGRVVSYANQVQDYYQRFLVNRTTAESLAEIADDRASRDVADALFDATQARLREEATSQKCVDTSGTTEDLKNHLDNILCD